MPRRILFVITKSNWGGAQRYVYDLAVAFHQKNNEVAVAVGGNGELAQRLRDAGIEVISIPSLGRDIKLSDDVQSFFSLLAICKNFRPTVIHLNSSKIGGLGALAGRIYNFLYAKKRATKSAHIVFTAHGWAFNEQRGVISKFILKVLYWITIVLSHRTIAVSYATARQVTTWPFLKNSISVVHNAVTQVHYKERDIAQKELSQFELPTSLKSWTLGTIAELHPTKNLLHACKAFIAACIPHSSFIIIGEGEKRKELEKIAQDAPQHNIILAGHKSQAASYLKAFNAFILPSISEGLGYVLLEAGNAQLPVIATNVGGIPEIIENEITGILVSPHDISAMTAAIQRLHSDTVFASKIATSLHEKVAREFSLQTMIAETEKVYENLRS